MRGKDPKLNCSAPRPVPGGSPSLSAGDDKGPERVADGTGGDGGQRHQRLPADMGRQGAADRAPDTRDAREEILPVPARGELHGQRLPEAQLPVQLLRAGHVPRLRLRAEFQSFPVRNG